MGGRGFGMAEAKPQYKPSDKSWQPKTSAGKRFLARKTREKQRKNTLQSLFGRVYGKFSANLRPYLVNFPVTLTP